MRHFKGFFKQKEYFQSIAQVYPKNTLSMISLHNSLTNATQGYLKGDVLVIGYGGVINFDIKKAKTITLTDPVNYSLNPLKIIKNGKLKVLRKNNKVKIIIKKASVLSLPFSNNSYDSVVMFYVAHHLSANSVVSSILNVKRAFKETYRVLRKGGNFLLAEDCPRLVSKLVEDSGYIIWHQLFKVVNKPSPYFLSRNQLINLLKKQKYSINKDKRIKMSGKLYQPLLPFFYPPAWFWEIFFESRFIVTNKD